MSKKHPRHTVSKRAREKLKARRSLQNQSVSTFCFTPERPEDTELSKQAWKKILSLEGYLSLPFRLQRDWDFSFGPAQVIHHIYKLDPQLELSRL